MIYKGTLKTLYASNIEVTENGVKVGLQSTVLEKDSLFYNNFLGLYINFKHNTHLPTYREAEAYVSEICSANPDAVGFSCLYADYSSITPAPEETKTVKQLKKEFKAERKKRTISR